MQNLIKPAGIVYIEDSDPVPNFDFVRLQRNETVKPRERVKPPTIVEDPPPAPQPKSLEDPDTDRTQISVNDFDKHVSIDPVDPGIFAMSEGDIVPVLHNSGDSLLNY